MSDELVEKWNQTKNKETSNAQDDNKEIMKLLQARLELGRERYGHGVRVNDDTRTWGTKRDSWEEMMLEEALDGMIYSAAAMIRLLRQQDKEKFYGHRAN